MTRKMRNLQRGLVIIGVLANTFVAWIGSPWSWLIVAALLLMQVKIESMYRRVDVLDASYQQWRESVPLQARAAFDATDGMSPADLDQLNAWLADHGVYDADDRPPVVRDYFTRLEAGLRGSPQSPEL
jgi:hypothetical protein